MTGRVYLLASLGVALLVGILATFFLRGNDHSTARLARGGSQDTPTATGKKQPTLLSDTSATPIASSRDGVNRRSTSASFAAALQSSDVPATMHALVSGTEAAEHAIARALNLWCTQLALVKDGLLGPALDTVKQSRQFQTAPDSAKQQLATVERRVSAIRGRCGSAADGIGSGFPPDYGRASVPRDLWSPALGLGVLPGSRLTQMTDAEAAAALRSLGENDALMALSITAFAAEGLERAPIMQSLPQDGKQSLRALAVAAIAGCELAPELCGPESVSYAYFCVRSGYVLCMTERPDETARLAFRAEHEQLQSTARAIVEAIRRGDRTAFVRPKTSSPPPR